MRTIKYKHVCPRHGIETCHCNNSDDRHRSTHLCTIESQGEDWHGDPLKFSGKRFVKDELFAEQRRISR